MRTNMRTCLYPLPIEYNEGKLYKKIAQVEVDQ